jgi:cytochrome b561
VALHVLAALKHQLVDRDGIMGRMLPGRSKTRR